MIHRIKVMIDWNGIVEVGADRPLDIRLKGSMEVFL